MLVSFGPPGFLPLISCWPAIFRFRSEAAVCLTSSAAFAQVVPSPSSSFFFSSCAVAQKPWQSPCVFPRARNSQSFVVHA